MNRFRLACSLLFFSVTKLTLAMTCFGQGSVEHPIDVRITNADSQASIRLPKMLEGRKTQVNFRLINDTSSDFTHLSSTGSCSCITVRSEKDNLKSGDSMGIAVVLSPSNSNVQEQIVISGATEIDGQTVTVPVVTLGIAAKSAAPISPELTAYAMTDLQTDGIMIKLAVADPSIKITDLEKVNVFSPLLEVKSAEEHDGHYLVRIGLKEGVAMPEESFSVLLRAPFVVGDSKELVMRELISFIHNPRITISPAFVRVSESQSDNISFAKYRGNAFISDYSVPSLTDQEESKLTGFIVTNLDGKVVVLDATASGTPDPIGNAVMWRRPIQFTLQAGLGSELKLFLVVKHENALVDFSLDFDAFQNDYCVAPIAINP